MKRLKYFADQPSITFSGLQQTLDEFSPVSEIGIISKKRLEVFTGADHEALARHHQRLSYAVELLGTNPESVDRIKHSLKSLPRIDDLWDMPFGQAELALLKNFRTNHQQISKEIRKHFQLESWLDFSASAKLAGDIFGKSNQKSFFLADDVNTELKGARAQISDLKSDIQKLEKSGIKAISEKHNLAEANKQWIVDRADKSKVDALLNDQQVLLLDESIASLKFGVKPDAELLKLLNEYEFALSKEREIEQQIYAEMEIQITAEKQLWLDEQRKLSMLDHLLAMAEMAVKYKAVKPVVSKEQEIVLCQGRHVPICKILKERNEEYCPLDLQLEHRATILTGTNMGGKTVVLQSFAWLQTLVQLGFFVSAKSFNTMLFDSIEVSASTAEGLGGLSGFGREISRLKNILLKRQQKTLYLVDEPGRTTHVKEGRAIVQAIVDAVAQSNSYIFLSTHLDGIDGEGVGLLKMAGLKNFSENEKEPSRNLQSLMDYRVVESDKNETISPDALKVAELLGLDLEIINRAKELLGNSNTD